MRIKETIERDCCHPNDMKLIGSENMCKIFQCKYCRKKMIEVWCGPGNNDFGLREYKKE